jgi:hypothetical protein
LIEIEQLLRSTFDEVINDPLYSPTLSRFNDHAGAALSYLDDCTIAVPACLANIIAVKLSDIFANA